MKRREFITLLGGAAAWPLAARAQQGERMKRIGVLAQGTSNDPETAARLTAFVQGLQELGWSIGRDARIEYRWGAANFDLTRRYAAELVALAPDVIFAAGGQGVRALLDLTTTVPIVFEALDPVGAGFAAEARTKDELNSAFTALVQQQVSALLVAAHVSFIAWRDQIIALAAHHMIAASYSARDAAMFGGLTSYGPSQADVHRQAGVYTGRILNGASTADLPVVQPTKFDLVINLKTAKTLGLYVPPKLLALADEVIE